MGKLSDFSDLIRLPLGFMASLSGLAAGFIVIRLQNPDLNILDIFLREYLGQIIIGFPIPLLIVCASMAINDYYDYPADVKNNRLDRPLVRNAYSPTFALNSAIIMFVIGLILTIILFIFWEHVEIYIIVAALFFILIAVSYSTWMKKTGLLGNIGVSSSYPAALILGGMVVGITDHNARITIFSFGLLIFFSALGRELLKGVMDIEGDIEVGVNTIAVRYGPKNAAIFSTVLFLIAVPFAPIPLIFGFNSNIISFVIYSLLIGLMVLIQLYSGIILIKQPIKEIGIKGRKTTKLAFWAGVLGFFLSALTI
ncbi:MAG: UbiA family prenyltransferase [Candidatus Hodarchaeales archaeon]